MAPAEPGGAEEPPPILGTWRRVHFVVLATLALYIALLSLFTWGLG